MGIAYPYAEESDEACEKDMKEIVAKELIEGNIFAATESLVELRKTLAESPAEHENLISEINSVLDACTCI